MTLARCKRLVQLHCHAGSGAAISMSGHESLGTSYCLAASRSPRRRPTVRRARHWIAAQLARTDPAELIDAAVLLVSELVTNAVHASAAAAAAARRRRSGPGRARGRADPRHGAHRGLRQCPRFASGARRTHPLTMRAGAACRSSPRSPGEWGCRSVQRGKVVWCELAAAVQEPPSLAPVPASSPPVSQPLPDRCRSPVSRCPPAAATASPPVASAGCIDLSRPVSVAARYP